MRSVVVEMCGLPGAGKTTLAGRAGELLTARGQSCSILDRGISAVHPPPVRWMRRSAHALRGARREPAWSAEVATAFGGLKGNSARDFAGALVQWLAVADLSAVARSRPGVGLLEEGFVQTLWTLLLRTTSSATEVLETAAMLRRTPARMRSDLVVLVDAPLDVVQGRLASRSSRHSRTQRIGESARLAELERGRALLDLLVAGSPVPVHRVNVAATGDTDPLAGVVARLGTAG